MSIVRMESGKLDPEVSTLLELCDALCVTQPILRPGRRAAKRSIIQWDLTKRKDSFYVEFPVLDDGKTHTPARGTAGEGQAPEGGFR